MYERPSWTFGDVFLGVKNLRISHPHPLKKKKGTIQQNTQTMENQYVLKQSVWTTPYIVHERKFVYHQRCTDSQENRHYIAFHHHFAKGCR